jgi:ATP-dependent protease HslVU (ClpYQ) peptidase subunit
MTVVAGLISDSVVYMGADRGASDGDSILSMNTPKIAKVNNWLIGYAGSGGLGQIVQHLDCWREHPKDVEKFLRMDFVEEYIKAREKVAGKDEEEAQLLIGHKGKLYEMDTSDYAIFPFGYTAIGSGGAIALGSLFSTENTAFLPQMRVEIAINAAITHNPACNGPIDTYIC